MCTEEELKTSIENDVEEFVEVLETYFEKEKIWEYKFQYKVKEEREKPFTRNYISIGILESALDIAYKKLFDKWFFKGNLLIQVISERLKKDSIKYTDCESMYIANLRKVSFSVQ